MSRLHIYGQSYFHEKAFIVGDKEALTQLRDAIDAALANEAGTTLAYVADGEGYDVEVYQENSDTFWEDAQRPYTDEVARDTREEAITPWHLHAKFYSR
jgi:hypothetical protein